PAGTIIHWICWVRKVPNPCRKIIS
ncbi:uncharacterized protein METZ01_LOCUS377415, partial [marine metagenome]